MSPSFHSRLIAARLRSNLINAGRGRRLAAAAWLAVLIATGIHLGLYAALLAIVVPMGPLYNASSLLQFVSEHRWMSGRFDPSDLDAYLERSQARIALAPLPSSELTGLRCMVAWLAWLPAQMLELLFRLAVTVGDLTVHDFHHAQGLLRQRGEDWPNAVYERQNAIDAGDKLGLANREALGWKAAFDWVFEGLANNSDIAAN